MLFVYIRISVFLMSMSVIFPSGTPKTFKTAFTLFLTVLVGSMIDVTLEATSVADIVVYSVIETINGLLLGYMVMLCFNMLKFAGSLMDFQMGLSMANIYDSNTQTNATLIDRLMYWMGIMIFFGINGHHAVISSMVESFNYIGVGDTVVISNLGYVFETFTKLFTMGYKIALPFVLTLVLVELLLGLISRSVPSFNVMMIGMPMKMLVGTVLITVLLPSIIQVIIKIMNNIPDILRGTFL